MIFECLNGVNWKRLLNLRRDQNAAVEKMISFVQDQEEIGELLKRDLDQLEKGTGKMVSTEEEREGLYGEKWFRMHPVLVLLMRLPWLIQKYQEHGIAENVLVDTLSDVGIWMNVCEKKTGCPGLLEYGWLSNHFSFRLFRLGRLQFVAQSGGVPAFVYRHRTSGTVMALCPNGDRYHQNGDGEGVNGRAADDVWTATLHEEGKMVKGFPIHRSGYALHTQVSLDLNEWELAYKPGDSVFDMHIAEGCPLNPDEVRRSLEMAPDFFKHHLGIESIKAFTCSSWLLDDNIAQMQPGGNIAAFQRFFQLIPHKESSDWQTRQRAFGSPEVDILTAECKTSLQKAIRAWYESGRYCRHAAGIILL